MPELLTILEGGAGHRRGALPGVLAGVTVALVMLVMATLLAWV